MMRTPIQRVLLVLVAALCLVQAAAARADDPIVEQWVTRLNQGPLFAGTYHSQAPAVHAFRSDSLKRDHGNSHPEVALLAALQRAGARRPDVQPGGVFDVNVSLLAEDLYLRPRLSADTLGRGDRMRLAQIRAQAGAQSVKTARQLGWSSKPGSDRYQQPLSYRVAGKLPGTLGAALRLIRPTQVGLVGFPSISERWARSAELRGMLRAFNGEVVRMRDQMRGGGKTVSVWDTALRVTGGDARLAAEMLGPIIGQKKCPLRYVEREVLPRHPEARGADDIFAQAARSYFMLSEIHELALQRDGRSNLYPAGVKVDGFKFWHFYGATALALNLAAGGHGPRAIGRAGRMVALGYEGATIGANVGLEPTKGLATWRKHLRDSARDVRYQLQGNAFARSLTSARTRQATGRPGRQRRHHGRR